MLLIAQPKSASTSLAHTIAKTVNINYKLGIPRDDIDIDCHGFDEIQKYHNNMIERPPIFIKQVVTGRKTIFKEHLLPTDRHLRILEKFKKHKIVILLRNPDDSFDSYMRVLTKKPNRNVLLNDLQSFHNRYMWWDSRQINTIIVYYQDLILNYVNTMRKIFKWYGITPKKIIPLMRYKYTGIGEKRIKKCC
jgi:hypothetical protein